MSTEDNQLVQALKECIGKNTAPLWDRFMTMTRPVIAAAVTRTLARYGCTPGGIADDLIQDTFVKLCAKDFHVLRSFRGEETNALYAYLRTVASSIVVDHLNAGSALKKGGGLKLVSLDDPAAGAVAADGGVGQEVESNLLLGRVENCLSTHQDRDRQIFWLYHRHGFSPEAISRYPGVALAKSGVETILYRLTRLIRDCVRSGKYQFSSVEGVGA